MKRQWRTTLGILNIIVSAGMLAIFGLSLYVILDYGWSGWTFTFSLPFLVGAILTSIGGILTLKGRHRAWAFAGLIFALAAFVYFLFLYAYMAGPK